MMAFFIAVIFVVMSFLSLGFLHLRNDLIDDAHARADTFLEEEGKQMESWYRQNIMSIDSNTGQVQPTGVSNRLGLTVLSSNRLNCNGETQAHRYALVIPGTEGIQTTMDPDTGAVTQGKNDKVRMVDGCAISIEMVQESKKRAQHLVNVLENYFKVHATEQPSEKDKNFFVNSSCGGKGDLPCVAGTTADILTPYLGIGQYEYTDDFSNKMLFDNASSEVNVTTQPYSAGVGFTTPWGTTIWATATAQY